MLECTYRGIRDDSPYDDRCVYQSEILFRLSTPCTRHIHILKRDLLPESCLSVFDEKSSNSNITVVRDDGNTAYAAYNRNKCYLDCTQQTRHFYTITGRRY